MEIRYTKRVIGEEGIGPIEGPYWAPLGYLLFVERACYFGVLPPYTILNKMLLDGGVTNPENVYLTWQPFSLTKQQYSWLKRSVEMNPHWGGEVDESYKGNRAYWEHWAMLRLSEQLPLRKVMAMETLERQAG